MQTQPARTPRAHLTAFVKLDTAEMDGRAQVGNSRNKIFIGKCELLRMNISIAAHSRQPIPVFLSGFRQEAISGR